MNREQLLNGLYYVDRKIGEILNLYEGERQIEAQFRKEQHVVGKEDAPRMAGLTLYASFGVMQFLFLLVSISDIFTLIPCVIGMIAYFVALVPIVKKEKMNASAKKAFIVSVVCVILTFGVRIVKYPQGAIWMIIFVAIAFAIGIVANNLIAKKRNVGISAHNDALMDQYEALEDQIAAIREELYDNTQSWYPKDYYDKYVVEWFINAVENYRCDSIKELIREFETSEYQKEMLRGQQELKESMDRQFEEVIENQQALQRQLRFTNVLQVVNIAATLSVAHSLSRGRKNARKANRIARRDSLFDL